MTNMIQATGNSAHQTQEVVMAVRFLSATDVAISRAAKNGTLRLMERPSRFGDTFISIEDAFGVIEVQLSWEEARDRVKEVAQ